ncbi:hypothetical protein Ae201684P_013402 [Aphanomyces euteiches]|uniref:Uncharacterized protein n=1 Tax=Aphanomyces euteiches TaxID=100861 RepID=A0A6G0WD69_9STRA|nr:hypothetical protein Ae201684_016252 [Aphanomyces euteiches]KAH9095286.1 hypothetical protein Ae201684P_013402 [Aphanomyces euteiches]KAH9151469.1 hypothetical protein AeRB84_005922 [Aphanomyces euteiches]
MAAPVVAQSRELLGVIFVYQHGIPEDMLPFLHLPSSLHPSERDIRLYQTALSPWYLRFPLSRLHLLFALVPRMRSIVAQEAISSGNMTLLCHLHKMDDLATFPVPLIDTAARFNQVDILSFLQRIPNYDRHGYTIKAAFDAALFGHLECVQFLVHNDLVRFEMLRLTMEHAARGGHLHIITWLLESPAALANMPIDWMRIINAASIGGHFEIVKFACIRLEVDSPCYRQAMWNAARHCHFPLVEFLMARQDKSIDAAEIYRRSVKLYLDNSPPGAPAPSTMIHDREFVQVQRGNNNH